MSTSFSQYKYSGLRGFFGESVHNMFAYCVAVLRTILLKREFVRAIFGDTHNFKQALVATSIFCVCLCFAVLLLLFLWSRCNEIVHNLVWWTCPILYSLFLPLLTRLVCSVNWCCWASQLCTRFGDVLKFETTCDIGAPLFVSLWFCFLYLCLHFLLSFRGSVRGVWTKVSLPLLRNPCLRNPWLRNPWFGISVSGRVPVCGFPYLRNPCPRSPWFGIPTVRIPAFRIPTLGMLVEFGTP